MKETQRRNTLPLLLGMALIPTLLSTLALQAESRPETLGSRALRVIGGELPSPLPDRISSGCVINDIACGHTVTSNLSGMDCFTKKNTFFDIWRFEGAVGDEVTIRMTSSELDPNLLLFDPGLGLAASNDDGGSGLNARIVHTLDKTGAWTFFASGFPGRAETGNYTLSLDCRGVVPGSLPFDCTPGAGTLCLAGGRFRVEADWRTREGISGLGQAQGLTADSGYFWFFDPANVEVVVKVVDACSLGDRFWVFAGGLTNLEVNITFTDTESGQSRTYTNPASTSFQSIQDTSSFDVCP